MENTQKEVGRLRTEVTNIKEDSIRSEMRLKQLESEVSKTVIDVKEIKNDISSINKVLHQLLYLVMGAIIYGLAVEFGIMEVFKKIVL